jgi:phenylacetate-CoA ligase
MTSLTGRIYEHLPLALRSAAATARGTYLRMWRYSARTDRLVAEALERERWSAEQWAAWRDSRLGALLERAATRVPYYRAQWEQRRRNGDQATWELLENWPLLEKEPLRSSPKAFMADDRRPRAMFHEHTSGTTGTPIDLWFDRETVVEWYALFEARGRRWHGVSRHDRWAMFGGQMVVPVRQRHAPFWVWNAAFHQLYCSVYHLAPDLMPYYVAALRQYRVRYLWGYSSALYTLAQHMVESGEPPFEHVAVALTNAEPLYPHQRAAMEQAFGCPVRETYGMSEIAAAASECEHGTLHSWPEAGIIEVLPDAPQDSGAGSSGELVVTGLLNPHMPLIRYRTGDRGALCSPLTRCACGRTLPALANVEGRMDDALVTLDGRRIGRLDPVFKSDLHLREAQIVQEEPDRIRVRYVPDAGFTDRTQSEIAVRIRERMGDVRVDFERLDSIPRGANGKFKAVVQAMRKAPGAPSNVPNR